eukprot:213022-Rhodomonas_salina.2
MIQRCFSKVRARKDPVLRPSVWYRSVQSYSEMPVHLRSAPHLPTRLLCDVRYWHGYYELVMRYRVPRQRIVLMTSYMVLRFCYAMSGTEAANVLPVLPVALCTCYRDPRHFRVASYALAMRYPVLA